ALTRYGVFPTSSPVVRTEFLDRALSWALLDKAEKNGDRDHGIARKYQPRQNETSLRYRFGQFTVIHSQRLGDARDPVAEMTGKKKDAKYIEKGNQRLPKAEDQHSVDVVTSERIVK